MIHNISLKTPAAVATCTVSQLTHAVSGIPCLQSSLGLAAEALLQTFNDSTCAFESAASTLPPVSNLGGMCIRDRPGERTPLHCGPC
jgi:predicted chitinase